MRNRIKERLRKSLRGLHHKGPLGLLRTVDRYEREGVPLDKALHRIAVDAAQDWSVRAKAAAVLALATGGEVTACLLKQFFAQEEKVELYSTALTLETLGDPRAVKPLIRALDDPNPHRRHAATRALGWIPNSGNRAVGALIRVLTDTAQHQPAREEAAESLAYLHSTRSIQPLISALSDPDVRIRFWAVFALGSIRDSRTLHHDPKVVPALEAMLSDNGVPPGNWWSVGREALAMLALLDRPKAKYRERLVQEINCVLSDLTSSPEDQRWATNYARFIE